MSNIAGKQEVGGDMNRIHVLLEKVPPELRRDLESAIAEIYVRSERRARILTLMQEALSQLRLDTKYLLFDLEATRRERDALQDQQQSEDWD